MKVLIFLVIDKLLFLFISNYYPEVYSKIINHIKTNLLLLTLIVAAYAFIITKLWG